MTVTNDEIVSRTLIPTLVHTLPRRMTGICVADLIRKLGDIGIWQGQFEYITPLNGKISMTLDDLRESEYYLAKPARSIAPIRFLAGPNHAYKVVTSTFLHYAIDRFVCHLDYSFRTLEFIEFFEEFQKVLRIDENYP